MSNFARPFFGLFAGFRHTPRSGSGPLGPPPPGLPSLGARPNASPVGLSPGYPCAPCPGRAYSPFSADGDPNNDNSRVPNLALPNGMTAERYDTRHGLLNAFDHVRRDIDASGLIDADEAARVLADPKRDAWYLLNLALWWKEMVAA